MSSVSRSLRVQPRDLPDKDPSCVSCVVKARRANAQGAAVAWIDCPTSIEEGAKPKDRRKEEALDEIIPHPLFSVFGSLLVWGAASNLRLRPDFVENMCACTRLLVAFLHALLVVLYGRQ